MVQVLLFMVPSKNPRKSLQHPSVQTLRSSFRCQLHRCDTLNVMNLAAFTSAAGTLGLLKWYSEVSAAAPVIKKNAERYQISRFFVVLWSKVLRFGY
jgi:hypothetical protein